MEPGNLVYKVLGCRVEGRAIDFNNDVSGRVEAVCPRTRTHYYEITSRPEPPDPEGITITARSEKLAKIGIYRTRARTGLLRRGGGNNQPLIKLLAGRSGRKQSHQKPYVVVVFLILFVEQVLSGRKMVGNRRSQFHLMLPGQGRQVHQCHGLAGNRAASISLSRET